ncbi:hypothetical protein ARMGADRAFT_750525 [Armillaria gallica]|uniref:Uncharacterized protein n=1 Tax=Armillaria gallica TaxID=47427 RepID=A0A2H3E3D5_ARMGA|nr:hypothetical protein ARMGADRAFT_750525 [Armillaria gallica]
MSSLATASRFRTFYPYPRSHSHTNAHIHFRYPPSRRHGTLTCNVFRPPRSAAVHSHSLPSPTPSALGSRQRISVHDSYFPGHNMASIRARRRTSLLFYPNRKHNPVHLHPYRTWLSIHLSQKNQVVERVLSRTDKGGYVMAISIAGVGSRRNWCFIVLSQVSSPTSSPPVLHVIPNRFREPSSQGIFLRCVRSRHRHHTSTKIGLVESNEEGSFHPQRHPPIHPPLCSLFLFTGGPVLMGESTDTYYE